jgi:hypothetical protein
MGLENDQVCGKTETTNGNMAGMQQDQRQALNWFVLHTESL